MEIFESHRNDGGEENVAVWMLTEERGGVFTGEFARGDLKGFCGGGRGKGGERHKQTFYVLTKGMGEKRASF